MTTGPDSSEGFNGRRTLELAAAVFFITEEISRRVKPHSQTVLTIGVRSLEEQQLLGLAHVLCFVYPLVIEFSLKSLWHILHADARQPYIHHLEKLFQELPNGATDVCDASRAQDEARSIWANAQSAGNVSNDLGTLDDFLKAHANDFHDFRYNYYRGSHKTESLNYKTCLLAILGPLAKRDPQTWANLMQQVSES